VKWEPAFDYFSPDMFRFDTVLQMKALKERGGKPNDYRTLMSKPRLNNFLITC
jgi:hypothetical protein